MGETLAVPSAHDERWYRRGSWVVVCLVVLLLVAGALHGQIWFDESYSVALARESLADIWRIGAADVHPVLYYVALHGLYLIFGENLVVYRLFSCTGLVAAVMLGPTIVRRDFGVRVGFWFSLLVGFCPYLLYLAEQIRMYSWTIAAIAYCLVMAVRVASAGASASRASWAGLVASSYLAACLHYYGALTAAALMVGVLVVLVLRRDRLAARRLLVLALVELVLYLPFALVLVRQAGSVSGGFWIPFALPRTIFELIWYPLLPESILSWLRTLPTLPRCAVEWGLVALAVAGAFATAWAYVRYRAAGNTSPTAWRDALADPSREAVYLGVSAYLAVLALGAIASAALGTMVLYYRYLAIALVCPALSLAVVLGANPERCATWGKAHEAPARRFQIALVTVLVMCALVTFTHDAMSAYDPANGHALDTVRDAAEVEGEGEALPVVSAHITVGGVLAVSAPDVPQLYLNELLPMWGKAYEVYVPPLKNIEHIAAGASELQDGFVFVCKPEPEELAAAADSGDTGASALGNARVAEGDSDRVVPDLLRKLAELPGVTVDEVIYVDRPYEGTYYAVSRCSYHPGA